MGFASVKMLDLIDISESERFHSIPKQRHSDCSAGDTASASSLPATLASPTTLEVGDVCIRLALPVLAPLQHLTLSSLFTSSTYAIILTAHEQRRRRLAPIVVIVIIVPSSSKEALCCYRSGETANHQ